MSSRTPSLFLSHATIRENEASVMMSDDNENGSDSAFEFQLDPPQFEGGESALSESQAAPDSGFTFELPPTEAAPNPDVDFAPLPEVPLMAQAEEPIASEPAAEAAEG